MSKVSSRCWGALAVAALGGTLTIACSSEEESSTPRVITQNQSALGSFHVLDATSRKGVVLWATEWAEIGDRVKVFEGNTPGGVSNSGTGILRVGSDAKVGSIWAEGSVDLRDRATVNGSVFVNSSSMLTQGNQVAITSGVTTGDLGTSTDIFDDPPSYPVQGGHVRLEPGEFRLVEPGHYGELVVKPNSTVRLFAGDYSFSRVYIESGSKVQTSDECAISRVRVREAFFFRGQVQHAGDDGGMRLAIAYDGTQTAHVEQPFSGAILAHKAELILSSHEHRGRFFAKRLRVQAGAKVVGTEILQCGTSGDIAAAPPVVPADLGPAPPLTGPADLDDFLEWFYRIRKSEIEEARSAILPVTNRGDVLSAVMDRFDQARSARNVGKALMLLEFAAIMQVPDAELAMNSLLAEPITFSPEPGDGMSRYHDEVEYRRRAIFSLTSRGSSTALAAVRGAAFHHVNQDVRAAAIRALSFGATEQERDALKAQVQSGDEFFVDRPNRADPDFATRYAQMQQTYTVQ